MHNPNVGMTTEKPDERSSEITVFPWRELPQLKARTINRVRTFLKSQILMRAAAQ